uniref:Uncharacterized protein n=1 Tax=Anopheles melas TaxID=34690 RepID=A0A182TZ65_9DIPT
MATRLAAQRNFIAVIPAVSGGSASVTVEPAGEAGTTAVQKPVTEPAETEGTANGTSQTTAEVVTVSVASSSPTVMATRPGANSTQLPTITIAGGGLKNGNAKGSLVPTALLANNSNIMNILSNANGLSLQQIIQQKKIVINTNGTLIDLVQLNDDNESVEIKADGEKLLDSSTANEGVESGSSGSEATADETPQVAVVQSPGGGTPQYITVTANITNQLRWLAARMSKGLNRQHTVFG